MIKPPQLGQPITAAWGREVAEAIRAGAPVAGAGLRMSGGPGGVVIAAGPRPRGGEQTDTGRSAGAAVKQRSVERGDRGLQMRNFGTEEPHAKISGLLGDWIEADPETGEIRAKEGKGARCIELCVRVTDGTGLPGSNKEIKYLRLDVPDPDDPGGDDVSVPEPAPPPPCGHPGNDGGGFGSQDSSLGGKDHPEIDPWLGEHPGDTVSPPCSTTL